MQMVYIIIILCVIIIILSIRLYKKRQIENNELKEYNSKLEIARANLSTINYTCEEQNKRVEELLDEGIANLGIPIDNTDINIPSLSSPDADI